MQNYGDKNRILNALEFNYDYEAYGLVFKLGEDWFCSRAKSKFAFIFQSLFSCKNTHIKYDNIQ